MNGLCKVWALLALSSFFSHTLAAGEPAYGLAPTVVGQRGNLDQLRFEGNKTFSAAAIQGELLWDFDVMLAAHPAAPWTDFLAILERKIVAGYRNSGFPDVRVDIRPEGRPDASGKLLVHVEEGPRDLAGEVKITGARSLSARHLTERLTKPYWSKRRWRAARRTTTPVLRRTGSPR